MTDIRSPKMQVGCPVALAVALAALLAVGV